MVGKWRPKSAWIRGRLLQPHAVRNRSAHTLQAIHEPAVVIVLVPKIEDGENDQRGHESSHGRFSFLGSDLHPGISRHVNVCSGYRATSLTKLIIIECKKLGFPRFLRMACGTLPAPRLPRPAAPLTRSCRSSATRTFAPAGWATVPGPWLAGVPPLLKARPYHDTTHSFAPPDLALAY
jgi:hypothetical protein